MDSNFTASATVFQSYQDNGKVMLRGSVRQIHVYGLADFRFHRESNPGPNDQRARAYPTEQLGLLLSTSQIVLN